MTNYAPNLQVVNFINFEKSYRGYETAVTKNGSPC